MRPHRVDYTIIKCRAEVGKLPVQSNCDAKIFFSDPILASYTNVLTGDTHIVFERASLFDDTFPQTVSDDPNTIKLEIRDQFDAADLNDRFGSMAIPTKFALVEYDGKTVIVEFKR